MRETKWVETKRMRFEIQFQSITGETHSLLDKHRDEFNSILNDTISYLQGRLLALENEKLLGIVL